jgi:hypothetical protein
MLKRFVTVVAHTYAEAPIQEKSVHGVLLRYGKLPEPRIPFNPIAEQFPWEAASRQLRQRPNLP